MSNNGTQPSLRLRQDFPVGAVFKLRSEGHNIWTGLLKIRKRGSKDSLGEEDAFRELKGRQGGRRAVLEVMR